MAEQKPLVLIIDDEEAIRDSCTQILLKSGFRTETAEDGAAGLDKVMKLGPDLVLVDLKMPGISGFDVLERLKVISPNAIPIVITGYATIDSAVEAMKRGAYDFLPKPFSPEELRIIIRRAHDRRRLILEAEALRKEKEVLEENFITMVSHQLRSPLVAVQQYFEVVLAGIMGPIDGRLKEMILKARDRLDGLLSLINDWLDLARINKGQIVDKFRPVDIQKVLEKLLEFMRPLAEESGVTLELNRVPGSIFVLGDEQTLEQAFTNLISNALKYNKPQGRIRISLKEDAESVSVAVEDTGIGIARKHLPLIFDQFYQVHRDGGGKLKGTGLGLSIVQKIVEAHKGTIDVSSEPGLGSTFTVRLPRP